MPMWTDLLQALQSGPGVSVGENLSPDWHHHGHGTPGNVRGITCHHTAGGASGNAPSFWTVVNGRSDLPGPLANLFLDRAGHWTVIAAGVGYHAGSGGPLGNVPADSGNQYCVGIEAESTGYGDWTAAQIDAYPRGVAALVQWYRLGVVPTSASANVHAHKEWTSRKIDIAEWPGDIAGFRTQVQGFLDQGFGPQPEPEGTKTNQELIDMFVGQDQSDGRLYVISGNTKLEFPSGGGSPSAPGRGNAYADELLRMFQAAYPKGPAPDLIALSHDVVERIPYTWQTIDGTADPDVIKTNKGEVLEEVKRLLDSFRAGESPDMPE